MKKLSILLFISLIWAQELQVDGDLTVTGNIQSATIASLQNEINNLYGIIDSLFSVVNTKEPIKLIAYNMDLLLPTEEGNDIIVYDTTFTSSEFEEFVRVELNVFSGYNQGAIFRLFFGPIGFEESQGYLSGTDGVHSNSDFINYNPQLWWNVPIIDGINNQQLRLYITTSNYSPYLGGISKLFIWGR